jgi:dissimilatory sulfite reductase (desulfoviridin) alpha/beta subunit
VRLDILIRRALRNASPEEAEQIRKALREGRMAEALPELVKLAEREGPLDIYYVPEGRFEAVEEREEVVDEVEEAVEEDGLEPVEEVEEVVEDDECLGQRVVRRVFPDPEERPRRWGLPY